MDKRTIIASHIDWDNKTAYVVNYGTEEIKLFKNLKDNGIELKDDSISDEEMIMLLRHCCTDGTLECVMSIENHYNRDQKEINKIKSNIEEKLKAKGLEIVEHCSWRPSFSEKNAIEIINTRNYLTILAENCKRKENEIDKLDEEIYKIEIDFQEHEKFLREQEDDLYDIKGRIKDAKSELEKKNIELNKLIERYKNGQKCIEEQRKNLPQDIKDMEDTIKELKEQKEELDKEYKEQKEELYRKYNEQKEYYDKEISMRRNMLVEIDEEIKNLYKKKDEAQKHIEQIDEQTKELENKWNEFNKLTKDINEAADNKRRFITTCRMYKMQGWELPQFEKDLNYLTDEETENIINEYYIK